MKEMRQMKHAKPYILLRQSYLFMSQTPSFTVDLHAMSSDYCCVVDVYAAKAPSHPHRHPGWFRFDLQRDGQYGFQIDRDHRRIAIRSADGLRVRDSWQSDSLEDHVWPLSVRIVLRKRADNRIVAEDRLIAYETPEGYAEDKQYVHSMQCSIRELPLLQYILPRHLQVKIVLRSFFEGNAAAYYAWEAWSLLQRMGIASEIYVKACEDRFRPFVHSIRELFEQEETLDEKTVLFYQYAEQDDALEDLLQLPCRKIAYFHGITDPAKLKVFDAQLAEKCQKGLDEIPKIAAFDQVLTNSQHAAHRLLDAFPDQDQRNDLQKKLSIAPPMLIGNAAWDAIPADDALCSDSLKGCGNTMLYVGRMYPHKRIEDILDVFAAVSRTNEKATLLLVGGVHHSYQKYLQYKIQRLTQKQQEKIILIPQASRSQMKAAFAAADIFITMSEDDGFCVPVWKAMQFHLPVLAKKAIGSAVPEMLDGAGKLICDKDAESIAAEINRIFHDADYREKIVEEQDKRLDEYHDAVLSKAFLETVLACYYAEDGRYSM